MATANYKFSVDWSGLTSFSGVNDDITSLVLEARWDYGRDYASQLKGKSVAGKMIWRVKNDDGRFNSFNTASPLSSNLLPGRPIQSEMEVSGTSAVMWRGFIDEIKPEPDIGGVHRAKISSRGSLHKINQEQVDISLQTLVTTGSAINAILDGINWPASSRSIDAGVYVMPDFWVKNPKKALNVLRDVENTEFGFIRETKDGKIAFDDRHHRTQLTAQTAYSDDVGSGIRCQRIDQLDPYREIFNSIEVPVNRYTEGASAVLWVLAQSGFSSPPIAVGGTQAFFAKFPNLDSVANAVGVDFWTTPVASTDMLANSNAEGTGTDFSSDVAITVSKFDTAMKIVLSNNANATSFITKLQGQGIPKLQPNTVNIRSEDSASQTTFGVRKFPVRTEFIGNISEAQIYADFLKEAHKNPIRKLELEFEATKDTDHLVEARDRDVSQRITVDASSGSKLGISEDFYTENMSHTVKDAGNSHRVRMQVSPVSGFGDQFWALETVGRGELSASTFVIF